MLRMDATSSKSQVFSDKSGNGAQDRVVCVRRSAGKGKIHEITFY